MIKLLVGRLLPSAVAVGLFTSALSPLRPALNAFGVATHALAGESNAGGVALPENLGSSTPGGGWASLFGPKEKTQDTQRQLRAAAEELRQSPGFPDRAPRPIKPSNPIKSGTR